MSFRSALFFISLVFFSSSAQSTPPRLLLFSDLPLAQTVTLSKKLIQSNLDVVIPLKETTDIQNFVDTHKGRFMDLPFDVTLEQDRDSFFEKCQSTGFQFQYLLQVVTSNDPGVIQSSNDLLMACIENLYTDCFLTQCRVLRVCCDETDGINAICETALQSKNSGFPLRAVSMIALYNQDGLGEREATRLINVLQQPDATTFKQEHQKTLGSGYRLN
jgi:hypothetical protein